MKYGCLFFAKLFLSCVLATLEANLQRFNRRGSPVKAGCNNGQPATLAACPATKGSEGEGQLCGNISGSPWTVCGQWVTTKRWFLVRLDVAPPDR